MNAPSSTVSSTFESELRAICVMFFLFSKGKVYDLFLKGSISRENEIARQLHVLDEVEHGDTVSDGTQDTISIRSEGHISLSVYRPTQVRELIL